MRSAPLSFFHRESELTRPIDGLFAEVLAVLLDSFRCQVQHEPKSRNQHRQQNEITSLAAIIANRAGRVLVLVIDESLEVLAAFSGDPVVLNWLPAIVARSEICQ